MQFLKRQFNLLRENVIQYKYRKEMNPTRNLISFSNVREEMRQTSLLGSEGVGGVNKMGSV